MSPDTPQPIAERFEVVRPLGVGSFGHTLLARDRTNQVPILYLPERDYDSVIISTG